ncbi:TIGR04255 family protein [Labedella endophytica]|uniref:TIGR04255 family protein n=1 Tax=Labedella endophytica TaxID=1523160 RepID=A0A433JTR7_9MICO|nr:TIGR04255 family protein [Labedella endophytica]RUR01415.1 TIGR04255 family protein [Labedella endophytica]
MTRSFPNAPLVELVVEVQWDMVDLATDEDEGEFEGVDSDYEPFYRQVAQGLAEIGYSQAERLVPSNYMAPENTPTYRYTSPTDSDTSVVYQVGEGVFGINAVPPYKTWESFRPAVQAGLRVLLDAIEWRDTEKVFRRIDLAYVDAFDDEFMGDGTRYEFLTKSLGFAFSPPAAITKHMDSDEPSSAFFQFSGKVGETGRIFVKAGLARVMNTPSIVLDTKVRERKATPADVSEVMEVLEASHQIIHESFIEITKPFADILEGGSQ